MFVGKDKSLPKSEAPEKLYIQVDSDPIHKYKNRLVKLAKDKQASLLSKGVTYGVKSFITMAPVQFFQSFSLSSSFGKIS
jgi:hypothetical protein